MGKNCQAIVMEIVEGALELDAGVVQASSDSESIAEWDSLGQLSILVALDRRFDGKVAGLSEMAEANSIQIMQEILKKHSIC